MALAQEAIRLAVVNAGLLGLIGAPTYPMLRDVTQRAIFGVLEENGIPFEFHKQENLLTLPELGSEIIFRTMDVPERLVGTNLAWFGVDELTYCKEASFLRLQARLRHPHAKELSGFGVWTPNGYDWVYDKFIGPSARPDYQAILAKPRENEHLPADFYDTLLGSYDEKFAKQEVLGEYLSLTSGRAYYGFDRALNIQPCGYNPALELCWSLDFNIDPMCSVIAQVEREYHPAKQNWLTGAPNEDAHTVKTIRVLDEIWISGGTTPDACEEFFNRAAAITDDASTVHVSVYGDAAGNQRRTVGAGAPTDWQAVRNMFSTRREFKPTFRYDTSNPLQKDRVNSVNAALCNHNQERRLFVDPKCTRLIKDLERVAWKPGVSILDKDTDKTLTHISDALGYMVWTEMRMRGKTGFIGGQRLV